jgi:pyridoxal phosphate enzyme (YggS family)
VSVEADEIAGRLEAVRQRIAQAAARAGRDADEIRLVGVTKGKPASLVAAGVRAGIRSIGENYVQECVPKLSKILEILRSENVPVPRWHFIGRLQRNKARQVAPLFDVVETLDRPALGAALDRRAEQAGRKLEVLLQTNVSGEPQKGGVEPGLLPDLLAASRAWRHLRVVGLMAVPAAADDPEASRGEFARLRSLRDEMIGTSGGEPLRELSMGMSQDFEVAIEEGATIIRVGTALFGPRED